MTSAVFRRSADPPSTASRRGLEKRGRRRSARISHNQLAWQHVVKCGNMLQNERYVWQTVRTYKLSMAKCVEF